MYCLLSGLHIGRNVVRSKGLIRRPFSTLCCEVHCETSRYMMRVPGELGPGVPDRLGRKYNREIGVKWIEAR